MLGKFVCPPNVIGSLHTPPPGTPVPVRLGIMNRPVAGGKGDHLHSFPWKLKPVTFPCSTLNVVLHRPVSITPSALYLRTRE